MNRTSASRPGLVCSATWLAKPGAQGGEGAPPSSCSRRCRAGTSTSCAVAGLPRGRAEPAGRRAERVGDALRTSTPVPLMMQLAVQGQRHVLTGQQHILSVDGSASLGSHWGWDAGTVAGVRGHRRLGPSVARRRGRRRGDQHARPRRPAPRRAPPAAGAPGGRRLRSSAVVRGGRELSARCRSPRRGDRRGRCGRSRAAPVVTW